MRIWKWYTLLILSGFLIFIFFDPIIDVLKYDSTYIALTTSVVAIITTVIIGYKALFTHNPCYNVQWFTGDLLLSLGMVGTLIGFLIVLSSAFADVDPSNTESIKDVISVLGSGMGTALVTTLFGLIFSIFIKLQLVVVDESA